MLGMVEGDRGLVNDQEADGPTTSEIGETVWRPAETSAEKSLPSAIHMGRELRRMTLALQR